MKKISSLSLAVPNHKFVTALFLICLSLFSFQFESVQADSGSDDYKLAAGLYQQKRYELAVDSFKEYIKKYPAGEKIADARYYYGLSLYRIDQYEKSHSVFQEVINKHPEFEQIADVRYRLAESSYFQEKYSVSETEFRNFLNRYPKNSLAAYAYPYLGDIQLSQNKYEEAIKSFQKSIELFPEGLMIEDSKFGLAKAYTKLKQFDKAIPVFEELQKLENGERQGDALFHLATIYFDEKNYEEAAKTYVDLDSRFKNHDLAPLSRVNAGYSYYKLKQYESAIVYFQKAAKSKEHLNRGDYWTGLSYKALEEYEKAAEYFDKMTRRKLSDSFSARNHYYRAVCEHRSGQYEKSKKHFLEYVEKWPKDKSADDSLYFASEAALYLDQYAQSKMLILRMSKEYPRSPLFMHQRMLKGRVFSESARSDNLDSDKKENEFAAALKEFRYVFMNSRVPRTQMLARYYAGQTLRDMKNPKESVTVLKPLVDDILKQKDVSEYIDALAVQARNYHELKNFESVMEITARFLELVPEGKKQGIILSLRAKAAAALGEMDEAVKSIKKIAEAFPQSPYLLPTRYAVAETAYGKENWKEAEQLFGEVLKAGKESKLYATSLSGLAWSAYKQKNYEKSKSLFKQIVEEFHDEVDLGPEASFMYAQSLQDNKELEKAAEYYLKTFNQYSPTEKNEDEKEKTKIDYSKNPYVYRAGLQAARVLRRENKISESDKAYEAVLDKYPHAENKDLLYDEWALLNYENEKYDRADEIFRLLIRYCPDSSLVDNAKLSLAQSDYLNGKHKEAHSTFKILYDDKKSDEKVREVSLQNLIVINIGKSQWKTVSGQSKQFIEKYSQSDFLSEVKFYRAESLLHLHYDEDAVALLTELNQQADTLSEPTGWQKKIPLLLAELHFRKKEYSISEKLVVELKEKFPGMKTLYQGDEILGRCYKQQAKFDLARKSFKAVIENTEGKQTETAAKSQFLIAECYMIEKNYSLALKEYLKVYHVYDYPRWQAAGLLQAAKCDEKLNQWSNAVKSYEEILEKFPKSELRAEAKNRLQVARTRVKG